MLELFTDRTDPRRDVGIILVEAGVEHLRQHERETLDDCEADARGYTFHSGPEPLRVTHLIAVRRTNRVLDMSGVCPEVSHLVIRGRGPQGLTICPESEASPLVRLPALENRCDPLAATNTHGF